MPVGLLCRELNLSDCQHVTDEAAILLSKYEATGLAAQHSEEANHPQSQNETKPGQVILCKHLTAPDSRFG